MSALSPEYIQQIATILSELGIAADFPAKRRLVLQPEATELVSIGPDDAGRDCRLIPQAAEAFKTMRSRAQVYGIELIPLSGFRSVERQAEIIRGKLALGEKLEDVLHSIAPPGYSEHHTGCAIDIGTRDVLPLEEAFAGTAAYAWLTRHGSHFRFRLSYPRNNPFGFVYEPWHWCWEKPFARRAGAAEA
jgi:zinc D-Ala-D-Ala carboxypeptidase